jgi:hypothetical protein
MTRVAFVGQGVYFRQCALEHAAGGLEPHFLDFRAAAPPGPLSAKLVALDPDVVLVFRPEIIPRGLFASLRAVTIGYLTEPLPRVQGEDHPDLRTRMWWLEQVDAANFDRIVSFDPLIAETAATVLPVWRSLPLPVADGLFMDVRERARPPRLLFIGRSTPHREEMLAPLKARHEVIHIGHGLFGNRLVRFLRNADVELNIHNNPYPSFENRVSLALAAGHLVISEPLSPTHGLRAGIDYVETRTPRGLLELADRLREEPDAFLHVQRDGHRQGERFRASRVFPQLIKDALADVEAHGGRRESAPHDAKELYA